VSLRAVEVNLPGREYEVRVGSGVLDGVAAAARSILGEKASRAFVVVDTGVPESFARAMKEDLESHGLAVCVSRVTPTEQIKSIDTYHRLLCEIAASGHTRVDPVIALGGGVVGDISGFVGASYQRGVPVIQCPTTLLSMVDASVGGKTGVNLSVDDGLGGSTLLKNLVGAFHQPRLVVADIDVLDSLDLRHRRAGTAECVKHGMICRGVGGGHDGLFDWMVEHLDGIGTFDASVIEELVARNVAIKAGVVVSDEFESTDARAGGRMLLNFGHTFGHAIETISGLSPDKDDPSLSPLHHGEAVGLGMIAACHAGEAMGLCDESVASELDGVLGSIGLPTRVIGLPTTDEILERMMRDKKAAGGALRVILPVGRGKCEIVDDADPRALACGIDAIRG
jgi:3-dehydroquinate synthase